MDALSAIVTLLKPRAAGAKIIHGAGKWGVRYPAFGHPSFALMLKGSCWLAVDGLPAQTLDSGDFVLFPAMPGFIMGSDPDRAPVDMTAEPSPEEMEEVFHGDPAQSAVVSMLGGYFAFDSINAGMLERFLPKMLRIRASEPGSDNVAAVVGMIQREVAGKRAGHSLVVTRLLEVMLVEALRSAPAEWAGAGLLAGLRDAQIAAALRAIHTRTAHPWTLVGLAAEAAMSRSAFAERFVRIVGTTPLNYLLQWRLSVAKDMLVNGGKTVGETAFAVGYESASGFSTAFSREVGVSPREFVDGTAAGRGL